MPLTPADVHNVAFSKPPIGKRGYNEDEVDAFLDLVEQELARIIEENNDLRQRNDELTREASSGQRSTGPSSSQDAGDASGSSGDQAPQLVKDDQQGQSAAAPAAAAASVAAAPEPAPAQEAPREQTPAAQPAEASSAAGRSASAPDHNVQAAKIIGLAQEMADRVTGEAKSEADQLLAEARSQSEAMVTDARTKADALVGDARTKSESMVADAKTRADALQRQAKEKADALAADAERKHAEQMATIGNQRTTLEKQLDELRTFEREYRTRLKTYLESQLQELGQRGSAAPAGGSSSSGGSSASSSTATASSGSGFGSRSDQGN